MNPDQVYDVFRIRGKSPNMSKSMAAGLFFVLTLGLSEVVFFPVSIVECLFESFEEKYLIVWYTPELTYDGSEHIYSEPPDLRNKVKTKLEDNDDG